MKNSILKISSIICAFTIFSLSTISCGDITAGLDDIWNATGISITIDGTDYAGASGDGFEKDFSVKKGESISFTAKTIGSNASVEVKSDTPDIIQVTQDPETLEWKLTAVNEGSAKVKATASIYKFIFNITVEPASDPENPPAEPETPVESENPAEPENPLATDPETNPEIDPENPPAEPETNPEE